MAEKEDIMASDDLAALLGESITVEDIMNSNPQKRYELANLDPNNLEEHIVKEAEDLAEKSKWAVSDVLMQIQTTPNDAELIEAGAKLLAAAAQAQQSHMKVYMLKEKFKQQVYLQKMKLSADLKMNEDNNTTKILLSRDEIDAKLSGNDISNNVLDIDSNTNDN